MCVCVCALDYIRVDIIYDRKQNWFSLIIKLIEGELSGIFSCNTLLHWLNLMLSTSIILRDSLDDAFRHEIYAAHCSIRQHRRSWLQSWTCIYCHYGWNARTSRFQIFGWSGAGYSRRINIVIVCNHSSHVHTFCTASPVISKRRSDYVSTSNRCDRWTG